MLPRLREKRGIGIPDLWNVDVMNRVTQERYALYMSDAIPPAQAGYLLWWVPEFQTCLYELF